MSAAADAPRKLRVGVLVNPIAGLGGRAALKGSDDPDAIAGLVTGLEWNEEVHAFARGVACIKQLDRAKVILATAPGPLGEDVVKRATMFGGPVFEIVRIPGASRSFGATKREDTVAYARRLTASKIDLLLFVGGDGTAVDVCSAVGQDIPVLGVPAGVKMFSPVFAQTPEMAAVIVNGLAPGFRSHPVEVLDLDERSYRDGAWVVREQTTALVPEAEGVQAGKGGSVADEASAAADLVDWFRGHEKPGVAYLLASGTTIGTIKAALGGGTPLGVDVWKDGAFVAVDATEAALLDVLGDEGPAEILVSPTGTQGAVLGRGTAQISVPVIERVGVENVHILATPSKLVGLARLFVDTGDADLDRSFPEYVKVRTDAWTEKVFPLQRGFALAR